MPLVFTDIRTNAVEDQSGILVAPNHVKAEQNSSLQGGVGENHLGKAHLKTDSLLIHEVSGREQQAHYLFIYLFLESDLVGFNLSSCEP